MRAPKNKIVMCSFFSGFYCFRIEIGLVMLKLQNLDCADFSHLIKIKYWELI